VNRRTLKDLERKIQFIPIIRYSKKKNLGKRGEMNLWVMKRERRKGGINKKQKEVKEESRDYAPYSTPCIEQRAVAFLSTSTVHI